MTDFSDWPLEPVSKDDERVASFRMLLAVVDRLRAKEGGCPWDLKQTETSMGPSLVEEAHEWIEAIEEGDAGESKVEAGDVLMCTLLMCRIAQDEGRYDLGDAALVSAQKLVHRHPHVFGEEVQTESESVLSQWEEIKKQERADSGKDDGGVLGGLPKGLPALTRMARVVSKTTSAGFRWSTVQGAWDKVEEELAELREVVPGDALSAERKPGLSEAQRGRIEQELGDLISAAAIFGNYLGLDPERACRLATRRFEKRFRRVELDLGERLQDAPIEVLEEAWGVAKQELQDDQV